MGIRDRDGRDGPLVDEEKEKPRIEWENKMLFILMPSVGLIAFVFGLLGAILAFSSDERFKNYRIPVGVFLVILALLGAGGIAYGVVKFIQKRKAKEKKPEQRKE